MSKSNLWRWKSGERLSWLCQEGMLLGGGLLGAGHSYLFAQLLILGCIHFVESHPAARSLMIYSLFCVLVTHQRKIYFKKVLPCQVRFRTISPATLLGLRALWVGVGVGIAFTCHPQSQYQGEEIFFAFLFFPLPWPGAIVHMQMRRCQLLRQTQLFIAGVLQHLSQRLQTSESQNTHTHARTHTYARKHAHAHTLHGVYFLPQDINFPSHCSLGRRMQH